MVVIIAYRHLDSLVCNERVSCLLILHEKWLSPQLRVWLVHVLKCWPTNPNVVSLSPVYSNLLSPLPTLVTVDTTLHRVMIVSFSLVSAEWSVSLTWSCCPLLKCNVHKNPFTYKIYLFKKFLNIYSGNSYWSGYLYNYIISGQRSLWQYRNLYCQRLYRSVLWKLFHCSCSSRAKSGMRRRL